jgi:hypothetical protein
MVAKLKKIHSLGEGIRTRSGINKFLWGGSQIYQEIFVRNISRDLFDYNSEHILSKDFDVLLLLDACRPDTLEEVVSEYEFLEQAPIETYVSIAGDSTQWLQRTITPEYDFSNSAYITGNPHSDLAVESHNFDIYDEVWKYAWDDQLGTIPPHPLTERAIDTWRTDSPNQMIIHYMQPHFPSITHPELGSSIDLDRIGKKWEGNIWDKLRDGLVEKDEVWEAYLGNLRYVLDDIELLLDNLDANKVVLSADHANAFGERGYYGHGDFRVPSVRRVPWVSVDATDNKTHQPELARTDNVVSEEEVSTRLESLGYLS